MHESRLFRQNLITVLPLDGSITVSDMLVLVRLMLAGTGMKRRFFGCHASFIEGSVWRVVNANATGWPDERNGT